MGFRQQAFNERTVVPNKDHNAPKVRRDVAAYLLNMWHPILAPIPATAARGYQTAQLQEHLPAPECCTQRPL
jgi:hypothetical protein